MRRGASGVKHQIEERKARRGDSVYEMKINPKNAVNEASTDVLGIPLPESRAPVFAALADFQEAREVFDRLAKVIDRIAVGPGGEAYRQDMIRTNNNKLVGYACPVLRMARNKLVAAEPYCGYCPSCFALPGHVQPRCKKCGGRGWTTRIGWESCSQGERQQILKMQTAKP
jgi:hypothetical protein